MSVDQDPPSVRLSWKPSPFIAHLLGVAGLLGVVLAVAPGPVPAVAVGTVLVALACTLSDPRPSGIDVVVGASAHRCTEGDVVRYDVHTSTAGVPLNVAAHVEPAYLVELAGAQPWHLRSGTSARAFTLRPTSWLTGSPGRLRLAVSSRSGGWTATSWVSLPHLIAHPRPQQLPEVYAPPQLLSRLGMHVGRARGTGTEFAEIREYAPGDPLRDVNWRASARTRQLMVSQRYRDQAADVVVLIDHLAHQGSYDRRLLDAAVRGGTAVAHAYLSNGDRVGLVLFGSLMRWVRPAHGQPQRVRLLDRIVETPQLASYLDPELARVPVAAMPPRAIVFCFSPLLDGRMLSALGRLARRGHRLVVVDLAGVEPKSWPAGLAPQTPQVWREHRQLLRTRLAESGAMVVDDPGGVGAAVRQMARRGAI